MKKLLIGLLGWFGLISALSFAVTDFDQSSSLNTSPYNAPSEEVQLSEEPTFNEPQIEIEPAFITVGSIDTSGSAYYYKGTTSPNCSKILVEARNSSTGLYDLYELTEYSYGATSYRYGVKESWNNLAEGLMNYTFTAHCDGNQVKTTTANYTYSKPSYQYTSPSYSSGTNYYINVDGNAIQSPTYYLSQPAGASTKCKDGTYSFSQHRSGTCSHHGGVATWY